MAASLTEVVAGVTAKARRYSDRLIGEQNTKASLIEPVLEALGWDIRDPDEVHREYRATGKDSPVDYALKIARQPRLFLEAKALGETLADRRWVAQVLGYATVAGVEWCVLTDGDEYRFYNSTAPVDADEKMFCRVRLTDGQASEAVRLLGLMSRSNLEQNLLDVLWMAHFVDRRVKNALLEMVEVPDKALVRLIRQKVPKLAPKEISESMRRLIISVETPELQPEATKPAVHPDSAEAPKPRAKKTSRGKQQKAKVAFNVSLSELIDAGLLTAPLPLFRRYKGRDLEATLLPTGEVRFNGVAYATCSTAAEKARASITGRPMNTNGWTFWQFTDASNQKRELDHARREFLGRSKAADTEQPQLRLRGSA